MQKNSKTKLLSVLRFSHLIRHSARKQGRLIVQCSRSCTYN